MLELRGALGDVCLVPILKLLAEFGRSGRLYISAGRRTGELQLDDGRVVAASFGSEHGLAALDSAALLLPGAQFEFVDGPTPQDQIIALTPDRLVARLQELENEQRRLAGTVPSMSSVARMERLADEVGQEGSPVTLARLALGLLMAVDGHRSVWDIVGSQPLAPSLRHLNGLVEQGLIRIDAPPVEPLQSAPPGPAADPSAANNHASGTRVRAPRIDRPAEWAQVEEDPPVARASQESAAGASPPSAPSQHTIRVAPTKTTRLGRLATILGVGAIILIPAGILLGRSALQQPTAASALLQQPTPVLDDPGQQSAKLESGPAQPAVAADPIVTPASPRPIASPAVQSPPQRSLGPGASFRLLADTTLATAPQGWTNSPPIAWWADGAYRLNASIPKEFVGVDVPMSTPLGDVIVSATFRKVGGPPGGGYGIILRDQRSNTRDPIDQEGRFYVLGVGDMGDVGIWRREEDRWVDLLPWTHTEVVHTGGSPNELTASALGDQLSFLVNGVAVGTRQDPSIARGLVGIFVGGDGNQVALDHFKVQVPN